MSEPSFAGHLIHVPTPIVAAVRTEYATLASRYARRDWGPASLNGGRLAEALFRYLEWKHSGTYTAIGRQIKARDATLNRVRDDTSLADGIRFHIRRCVDLLFDVRNKRDVAHLGTDVDVKEMDSRLVMRLASWAVSEVVRIESGLTAPAVQALVDRLAATHLPLVEEVGGDLLVVGTHLKAADRALVALYHQYPEPLTIVELRSATKYNNATRFKAIVSELAKHALVHQSGPDVHLTKKGATWIEGHIDLTLPS